MSKIDRHGNGINSANMHKWLYSDDSQICAEYTDDWSSCQCDSVDFLSNLGVPTPLGSAIFVANSAPWLTSGKSLPVKSFYHMFNI